MPKIKTNKSIQSRIKITGGGKLLRRPTHQSHFNAKESSRQTRIKHGVKQVKKSDYKSFIKYLPYAKS
ncbi:MAG: 50S ribosomal protein L35 [Parcubacteria group bacterium]|nr:50S ribosomal protein L35 [Parcubacteria group bacterium]